jgi:GT2 family glycosyltransferase
MTCFNRRDRTLACLERLFAQEFGSFQVDLRVFLVDDGSSDGTGEAVQKQFDSVEVINGDGGLYWCGGMRLAWERARQEGASFYLWLNDDMMLFPDALSRLLKAYSEVTSSGLEAIVVGSACEQSDGALSYGGSVHASKWHWLRFQHITPFNDSPRPCDVFNGNCVLIPEAVAVAVGNVSAKATHASGDYEYALRARRQGIQAWVAPGYFGNCSRNSEEGTWRDPALSLAEQYRRLVGVKGQPPGQRFAYYRKYGGPLWPVTFVLVYFRPLWRRMRAWLDESVGRLLL